MPPSWPWVGRQDELSRIAAAIGRSGAAGLVVNGPAGVGKTRLVAEALARAPAAKVAVHRATATRAAATVPLAALSHLLPDIDLQRLRRAEMLRVTATKLITEGRARRVVVAVDDAHLLDEASAALVHHLATASPVFVLATVRDGEPAPDAIRILFKDRLAEALSLGPLSADEVGEALRLALDGPVSGSLVHHLAALSGGNPLLMTELLSTALADGRLVRRSGLWRLRGPLLSGAALPELVAARLSRLDPEVYAAVELVALGEPLGAHEVERLMNTDILAAAEREGLFAGVHSERRQQLRLVHPLYGEALRAAVTPLRARAAYRQLADALAATGARRRGDVLRLAIWQLEGGRNEDPGLLLRAAREDGALFDRGMAERLARAAEEAGGGLPARLVRADALRWQGRAEEADTLLADMVLEVTDERQRCHVAAVRASNLFYGLNRPADAARVIAETRESVSGESCCGPAEAARGSCDELDALQAEFWFNAGRVGDAAARAEDVLARPVWNSLAHASAAMTASISRTWSGKPDDGVVVAEQALQRYGSADGKAAFATVDMLLLCRCLAHTYAGRLVTAEQLATAHYGNALDRQADALQGEWALALGQLALFRGRVATARRWEREAAALIERHSPTLGRYGIGYALCFSAEAAALCADLPAVDADLTQVEALLPPETALCNAQRGRVWAAAARGETSAARDLAMASADALRRAQAHLHEAMACHDVVRLGAPDRVAVRLQELAGGLQGRLGELFSRHAQALAAPDAQALEEVAADFAASGLTLLAAEAAAEASDVYRRYGRTVRAGVTAERSRELAGECEGARTPALALADRPLPLTPREREIATLAARGLPDRDIAERLVVSERTVNNHLHHVYIKLGIGGRRQLSSIFPNDSRN